MSRSLWTIFGLGVLVVFLLATPTQALGCGSADPVDFHHDNGQWLVLQAYGCTEGLHIYDRKWKHNTEVNIQFRIDGFPYAFAPASNDGWWIISDTGRAYLLSENLQYENKTVNIPIEEYSYPKGFAIDDEGR